MGQRLATEFRIDNKPILATYHHWSGYTRNALNYARDILRVIEDLGDDKENLIELLESLLNNKLISGISKTSLEYLEKNGYKTENLKEEDNRNEGLCSCENTEMQELLDCGEMFLYVHIDKETVNIEDCFYSYTEDDLEWDFSNLIEYEDEMLDADLIEYEQLMNHVKNIPSVCANKKESLIENLKEFSDLYLSNENLLENLKHYINELDNLSDIYSMQEQNKDELEAIIEIIDNSESSMYLSEDGRIIREVG